MRKNYPPSFKAQVVLEILKEEKTISQLAAEHGIHPNQLTRWRNQAIEQLPQLFADDRKGIAALKAGYEKQIEELYAEVGRLTTQLAWLKKKVSVLSRDQRLALLDWGDADLPLKTQAELLGLNRSSLYYQPVAPSPEEIALKNRIDEIYTAHPYYGSRRITAELCRQGFHVNRKAVQRHMREMGIAGICPGPNLSKRNSDHRICPYLLRGLAISHPNHVWGIDITYIRLRRSWLYLVAIMDWYSRYVVSWELDQSLEISFVLVAVQEAFTRAKPAILNSDQGSQFTSPQYLSLLEQAEVQISMDGKGRATDNIFTERLWRSLKYEEVYLHDYLTPREARLGISNYLDFYNHRRIHQALDYQTPAEVYFGSQRDQTKSSRYPHQWELTKPHLFLQFVSFDTRRKITRLSHQDLTFERVKEFLHYLERDRKNHIRTRNHRLAVLHAFFGYIATRTPEMLSIAEQVGAIPMKRVPPPEISFLEREEISALFAHLPSKGRYALRDRALFMFLYNTGARVQEVADLRVGDLDLDGSPRVRLHGKGDKWRICPLWEETANQLKTLLGQRPREATPEGAIFLSQNGRPLTRFGIYKIVRRHTEFLRQDKKATNSRRISPHVFRHTAAMHLLESGVEVNVIRNWLGHVSLETTNCYAEITTRMKEVALRVCEPKNDSSGGYPRKPVWRDDETLLSWLDSL